MVPKHMTSLQNFEKIIMQFKFELCSDEYRQELISYCRKYQQPTAMIYLCLQSSESPC
jgi:hypothetical protein